MNKLIENERLEKGNKKPLLSGPVFTKVFNNEKNINLVEIFISSFLGLPLDVVKGHVQIKERDLEKEGEMSENGHANYILEYNGELINIELNLNA